MEQWNYVKDVGNPDKEGVYDVVLIFDEAEDNESPFMNDLVPTGKQFAVRESRWFGPASQNDSWLMYDQPTEGLAWHEESGSYFHETVYAWLPDRKYEDVKLPEGIKWTDER